MNKWIWPVTQENWQVLLANKIWAVSNELRKRRVTKGDLIIFYVKGTGSFKGIFEVASEWYDAKEPIWSDESGDEIKYPYQCKLEQVILGDVVFNEIISLLNFVKNRINPAFSLQAHTTGPANYGRPIDTDDYNTILNKMKEPSSIEEIKEEETTEHEEIIDKLQEIGMALGFEPYVDKEHTRVAKGSDVDLVWETKVANIGIIKYVFEVQSKGSRKSLITNLIQAINSPLVKKVIAVSDKEQLRQIKEQVEQMRALSESFKSMFVYLDADSVNKTYDTLPTLNEFKTSLQLM